MKDAIEQEIKWCEENRGMNSKEFEDGFIAGLKQAIFITNAAEQIMPNLVTTSKRLLEWAQSLPIVIPAGLESDMQEAIENFTVEEVLENTLAPDGAYLCGKCGLMSRTTKCENCGHTYKRP